MNESSAKVSVRILDKEYQIKCPPSERTDLLNSAEALNAKMCEVRDGGNVIGLDRIAVIAALNIVNELLHAKARDEALENNVGSRLKTLSERVESVLGESQQLDL